GGKERITLGYQRQKGGSEEGTYYVDGIGDVSVSAEIHINEFQLLAGTAIGKTAPGAPFGYFEGGFVILHHVISGTVSGYGSDSYSETKLGAQLQLGGIIPVGKSVAFDLGVSAIVKSSLFSDDEAGGFILGLHAGLAYVSW
ncbi:MAG TPA: hypothetical protein PLQ13_09820, partial [Candidatus Krumholzibacteria bacterium]|nr:hypothetical protein [Candidatus Krumholzibacteria bacterium]